MPHAILEYSVNLEDSHNIGELVYKAHAVMNASGLFSPAAIKTRAYTVEHFLVGEKGTAGKFIHITVKLLEGRTLHQRAALTQAMFDAFRPDLPDEVSLSVDIQDMVKETYRK